MLPHTYARMFCQFGDGDFRWRWLADFGPVFIQDTIGFSANSFRQPGTCLLFLLPDAGQPFPDLGELKLGLYNILLMGASIGIVVAGDLCQV